MAEEKSPIPLGFFEVREEVRRLFQELIHQSWGGQRAPATLVWQPRVNIGETAEAVIVEVELPGVQRKDVRVEVEGDILRIRGERRALIERRGCNYYHREQHYGHFERELRLPQGVDPAGIRARFHAGILTITLPKKTHP